MKYYKLLCIVTALSFAIAAISAVLAFQFWQTTSETMEQSQLELTEVIVAKSNIAPYTKITQDMIEFVSVPKRNLATGYMTEADVQKAIGGVSAVAITKGQQITTSMFMANVETDHLAYALEDGKVAIVISINEESGLSQMIRQNDRLTLIVTETASDETAISRVLMRDLRVIALGRILSPYQGKGEYSTLTLEVSEEEALILDRAEKNGSIRFIMQSASEEMVAETEGKETGGASTQNISESEAQNIISNSTTVGTSGNTNTTTNANENSNTNSNVSR